MREEQKKVIQKKMDRLEHLGIIRKVLTGYSSPVVLVKHKNQNLYRVCSDFCILNEKLVKINHAFPLDCIEQLGRKRYHYLSMIDLRDAFHTLQLALSSQKYCNITPYYGLPTYHYLHMGMGMSVSPQIWQQFADLVFQDDLIKHKQNFDVIMDDTFIHSTAEEHMDDLMDLFKVLRKYGLKLSPHKYQFFKKKIVYMGLEFQVQGDKVCYTPLKDKCDAIRNLESPKTLRQTRAFCGMVNFLSSFLPNLQRLLIPIYDLQKKAKKFKWTDKAEKAFNKIKKLLYNIFALYSGQNCEFIRRWLKFFMTTVYPKNFETTGHYCLEPKGLTLNLWVDSIEDGQKGDFLTLYGLNQMLDTHTLVHLKNNKLWITIKNPSPNHDDLLKMCNFHLVYLG